MNLQQIHAATVEGDRSAKSFTDSALDCILRANETPREGEHDSAMTQAMVYAQLATAAATDRLANTFQDASGAAYVGVRGV